MWWVCWSLQFFVKLLLRALETEKSRLSLEMKLCTHFAIASPISHLCAAYQNDIDYSVQLLRAVEEHEFVLLEPLL